MELDRDSLQRPLPPGWKRPLPEHLPRRTYWPAVLAVAVTLALLGPVTLLPVTAVGAVLGAVALIGWIGDMLHE
jgi:hypothetical protein